MRLPYRVDHVGSFMRPAELIEARNQFRKHEISGDAISQLEQKYISDLVMKELENDILPITNGEFERFFFFDGFHEHLDGCQVDHPLRREDLRMATPEFAALGASPMFEDFIRPVRCTGKIQNSKHPLLAQWLYLRGLLPESKWKECKMTVPPPTWWIMRFKGGKLYPTDVYKNDEEYCEDLAKAYREEIKALYDAGLRYFQVDDPNLAFFCDETMIASYKNDGDDPDALLDLFIKLHNACLRDKPADMHSAVHLCRGSMGTTAFAEGSYERIAPKVFKQLDYNTFFLEYDRPNSGGFPPLRHLPPSKNVILGLVTTKDAELEDLAELKARVMEAADIMAEAQNRSKTDVLERVGVSPQCGFASTSFLVGTGITEETSWAKMRLLKDLAKDVWGGDQD